MDKIIAKMRVSSTHTIGMKWFCGGFFFGKFVLRHLNISSKTRRKLQCSIHLLHSISITTPANQNETDLAWDRDFGLLFIEIISELKRTKRKPAETSTQLLFNVNFIRKLSASFSVGYIFSSFKKKVFQESLIRQYRPSLFQQIISKYKSKQ